MSGDNDNEFGLEALLDLHGLHAEIGDGFRVSMKARRVPADAGRPHGIQYALTLHHPEGHRVLGYDNAHAPDVGTGPSRRSRRRALSYDHRHYRNSIKAYDFRSPAKLLEDFWSDVERFLEEEGIA
jgi:hypothetical protein